MALGLAGRLTDEDLLALQRMTFQDYQDINEALRTGDQARLAQLDPEIRNAVSALNKLPDYGGTVLRGIHIDPQDLGAFLKRYREGDEVTEWAFTHTDKAVPYAGNVQFVIEGGPGKDVSWLKDSYGGQQEVMYPPGTRFKVGQVHYDPDNRQWTIHLQGLD